MNSILFFNEKLFIIFLFFHAVVNFTFEDYPYYLTLSNNNIFIIHHTGIDLYDSSFNKIEQIIQFSENEKMTKDNFSRIKIKYDNEYILSIINDRIYIFNNEGKFLYKSDFKLNYNLIIHGYSLTSIGLDNDEYRYVIGYFRSYNYLSLILYSYNIKKNINTQLDSKLYEKYYFSYQRQVKEFNQINNKELSCEYIKHYSNPTTYTNVILCFFFNSISNSIATTNYYISDNNKLGHTNFLPSIIPTSMTSGDKWPYFIKSEANYNRTLVFVWFHFSGSHRTYFATFNVTNNTMENQSWIENCSSEIYKTKINKFPKNKELALTYEINDTIIRADLYSNIDNIKYNKTSFELNTSCENSNGHTILYYNNNKNYYIYYCFKNCSDELYINDTYCLNLLRKEEKPNIIAYIIIIASIFIILLVISFFIYKRCTRKTEDEILTQNWEKSQKDDMAMKDILTDLLPDNN